MEIRAHIVKGRATVYHRGRRYMLPPEVAERGDLEALLARKPAREGPAQARAFLTSFDVIPEAWINVIGDVFSPLIRPGAHFVLLTLAFIAGVFLPVLVDIYGYVPMIKVFDLNKASNIGWAAISGFLGISALLVLHEFGHAAACRSVGVRADGLGVGIYLVMPSFFTKLSLVKLLSRRERIIVYTGGVYFQMLASILLTVAAWLLQERALLSLVHINNFTVLLNLIPVARFDGQKILAEFSDWIEARDPFKLVKIAIVAVTAAYLLFVGRGLWRNIQHLVDGAMHGGLTPSAVFLGGLSCLGLIFFTRSLLKMLKASVSRA
ncbi:hypothetical protein [Caulobacter sp. BP25]|uniref:hypothetical protein n=1 Tax=Caulobacter sp. BP25 TaxID=2048900 RepID=UPI000C129D42|nr:hypothetical protein [Caulobacter sp. BP25]PHY18824.1 hypothetical protein CSW59_10265 [Caulobacter sp. BP25]